MVGHETAIDAEDDPARLVVLGPFLEKDRTDSASARTSSGNSAMAAWTMPSARSTIAARRHRPADEARTASGLDAVTIYAERFRISLDPEKQAENEHGDAAQARDFQFSDEVSGRGPGRGLAALGVDLQERDVGRD